jgi:putative membrane protein
VTDVKKDKALVMKKLITLLMAMGTLGAFAQSPAASPDSVTYRFIIQAANGNLLEANTGQLAVKRAKSSSVKAFGAKMVTDHNKANTDLTQIVTSKGWQIPLPGPNDVKPDTMLMTSNGATFDKAYVTMMLKDHKETVQTFEQAATNVPDADVKAFINKTLPVLREHLASIQAIASNMGVK